MERSSSSSVVIRKGYLVIEVYTSDRMLREWLTKHSISVKGGNVYLIEPYKLPGLIRLVRDSGLFLETKLSLINRINLRGKRVLELRDYQERIIRYLSKNDYRGIICLPTGAGKTFIGVKLIQLLSVKTLIVVPTIDLLNQWRSRIIDLLGLDEGDVGVFGGGRREVKDITIITYQSASKPSFLQKHMDDFSLLILDEVHHLTGRRFIEMARRLTAPYRIGLTATIGSDEEKVSLLRELVGEIISTETIDKLTLRGYLANYTYRLIKVKLTKPEEKRYRELIRKYVEYLKSECMNKKGKEAYLCIVNRAKKDAYAREALNALKKAKKIALFNKSKLLKINELLKKHRDEKVIVFTRHVATAGIISYLFNIPKISADTPVPLREKILMKFREGKITKIVTAEALDEGVDVPDASVCIIISGKPSSRQLIQRIGRVLRPKGNKKAIIYEIITSNTLEEKIHKRRYI